MSKLCICGHETSQGRCWRLTCPTNGAGESANLVRDRVAAESARQARRIQLGIEFKEPPEHGFDRDVEDEEMMDCYQFGSRP